MSARTFLAPEARRAIGDVVRAIESQTCAEVVVTVRARSSWHRQVDLAAGAVFGFLGLLVYVYFPVEFADDTAPLGILACFAAGALLTASSDAIKRLFLRRKVRRGVVRSEARAAFVDQRVGSTRDRTGVLVYVSLLEREVEVVADVGIDVARAEGWTRTLEAVSAAVRRGADVDAFGVALREMGAVLGRVAPRKDDDVNELPDEVVA